MTIQARFERGQVVVCQKRLLALLLLGLLALALGAACGAWAYAHSEGWKPYATAGVFAFGGLALVLMAGNCSVRFDKRSDRADICRSCLCGLIWRRSRVNLNEVAAVVVRRTGIRVDQQGKEILLWSASLYLQPPGSTIRLFWSLRGQPVVAHALLIAAFLGVPLVGHCTGAQTRP